MRRASRLAGPFASLALTVLAFPAAAADKWKVGAPVTRDPAWKAYAVAGRQHMKQGDCKRALDFFDEALRSSVEPTLYRDRGLCHEQQQHLVPAVEDYRAYLTQQPDAPDSDDVRERLRRLEAQLGIAAKDAPPSTTASASVSGSASGSAAQGAAAASFSLGAGSVGRGGASAGSSDDESSGARNLDALQMAERRESDAAGSPLRRGRGVVIGPFLAAHGYTQTGFFSDNNFGVALRYSLGPTHTLISELGYVMLQSQKNDTIMGGFAGFLGYEARFGFDRDLTNAIYVGGGIGYQHLRRAAIGAVYATIEPRGRLGYRHVFGPNIGLEIGADGGYAWFNMLNAPAGAVGANTDSAVIGGSVALVLGF